jgi:Ala-tRNA(Pro) deacylase
LVGVAVTARRSVSSALGSAVGAVYGSRDSRVAWSNGDRLAAAGRSAWEVAAMSVVTEHLERRGCAFEVVSHRQTYTSIDEARALGIDAGEVLKTLAVRTGPGYALMVIPAARRLDLHLVREAVGDNHARLATEEELRRDFPAYDLGALPPLEELLGGQLYVDPEVMGHQTVAFAAGTQTESVKVRTAELFGGAGVTTMPLVKLPERGDDDPVGRRRAAQQTETGGGQSGP